MELIDFFIRNRAEVFALTLQHLFLVAVATGAAALAGIPMGILLTRRPALSKPVLATANILQTIPSLALFGFLIPVLGSYGIGKLPAIIALFLYSLLPIIRNTFTGINGVDPAVREAARGMGMTDWQMLTQVEIPLALNVIIAGLRVATVISVGTATIAAAIGAGGLGTYIFRGLRSIDRTLILAGAVPAAIMALGADFALGWIEKSLTPGAWQAGKGKARAVIASTAVGIIGLVIVGGVLLSARGGPSNATRPIVIGSKDFTESRILAELMAQAIESKAGLEVTRQFELSGDVCHRALLSGKLDGYAEYTGTAFTQILKHSAITDAREVYEQVKREYETQFNLEWLEPLGFQNTFAILVRGEDARRLHLKTISDAARYSPKWRAGFGQDFMSRQDGYPGLASAYGLRFAEPPREMDLSLTYQALANGQVDLIAGNSTDGLIEKLNLFQLEDDRHYFPPYEAAPIFRKETLARNPEIGTAIGSLAGKLNDVEMRRLNYAVDGEKRDLRDVVRDFLSR
ncbi:MAG TPA: glycine betaine ABC transporter substrate-binding protein [Blastocatellia bacterium]|jgi:osmoprotectant transport system permease protein|nr:glycine betaine ABC transporter substrate-binding protein [Blastocatellia bacterium]